VKDVEAAAAYIDSKLFRPPYGRISPFVSKLLRAEGYKIIMWHVLSGDFDKDLSPQKCAENVLQHAQPGSIIVFHDSTKAQDRMFFALPKVLEHFSNAGYQFKSIEW
jgi:peptidoglycan/xylan/chitin deacetylase (PgdA/CDA1 family)